MIIRLRDRDGDEEEYVLLDGDVDRPELGLITASLRIGQGVVRIDEWYHAQAIGDGWVIDPEAGVSLEEGAARRLLAALPDLLQQLAAASPSPASAASGGEGGDRGP